MSAPPGARLRGLSRRLRLRRSLRSQAERGDAVLGPFPSVPLGQLLVGSAGLMAAGLFMARGFIGLHPGRPVAIILGCLLAASAILGLSADHVAVRISPDHPGDVLDRELNRSRRHTHPLALLRVRCSADAGNRLITRLRTTDEAWWDRGDLIMLLPETDRAGAEQVAKRARDLVGSEEVRVALFPDDGLTGHALLESLETPRAASHARTTAAPAPDLDLRSEVPRFSGTAEAEVS